MTLARTTVTAAASYALGLIGRSRDHLPVPWTNSRVMDDCAAFCSHVLWNGLPGPILWVDNFKTAGDGSYGGGATDLQPWDVLLFDWEGNGVGNHVEFMIADVGGGMVRTYGANGSDTRAAAYRLRPKHYIMGRFRPAWSVGAPIEHTITNPVAATVAPTFPDWIDMNLRILPHPKDETGVTRGVTGGVYLHNLENGKKIHIQDGKDQTLLHKMIYNDGSQQIYDQEVGVMWARYIKAVR